MDDRTGNQIDERTASGDPGYDDLGDIGGKKLWLHLRIIEIAENPCYFISTHFHSYFDMFAVTGVRDQSDLDYGEAEKFNGGHHDGLRGENLGVLANHSPGLSGMSIIVHLQVSCTVMAADS